MIIDEEVYLKHHGIKGMKWGVRRQQYKYLNERTQGTLSSKDKRWIMKAQNNKKVRKVNKDIEDNLNPALEKLNTSSKYKGKALLNKDGKTRTKLGDEYVNDFHEIADEVAAKSISKIIGTSPSGRLKAILGFKVDDYNEKVVAITYNEDYTFPAEVEHANSENKISFVIKPRYDKLGFIVDFEIVEEEMQQTDISDDVIKFIEHHGVKGMKWGVRKVKVAGAAAGAAYLGVKFLSRFNLGTPVSVIAGIASAEAGAEVARIILNAQGNRKPPFYG